MLFDFLGKPLLGLARGWWILIAAIAITVAVAVINHAFDKVIENAEEKGASEQREGDLRETIKHVEEGNEARNAISDPGSIAAYNQCLRTARTPENCKRFLPAGAKDQR